MDRLRDEKLREVKLKEEKLKEKKLREEKLSKDTGADKPPKASRFVKPTQKEADAYFAQLGESAQARRFHDYYEANGWRVGRGPMKDWRAAARNWARRAGQYAAQGPAAARQESGTEQLDRVARQLEKGDFSLLKGVVP